MRAVFVTLAVAMLSGCGFYQTCPAVEETYEVQSGKYAGNNAPAPDRDGWTFASSSNHVLDIDRNAGTATLTYVDAENRTVEVSLRLITSSLSAF